ncbi:MAG: hypothetical protein Q9217_000510 [Psora testacea]
MIELLVHVVLWLCVSGVTDPISTLGVIICDIAAVTLAVHYLYTTLSQGYLVFHNTLSPLIKALHRTFRNLITALTAMESLASGALATLQAHNSKSTETKLQYLTDLKQEIKHRQCPETAITTIFHVIRISIGTPHLVDAGFSILSHLTKRLVLQDQSISYHEHFMKLLPVLSERLGDQKERLRQRAIAALNDAYSVSSTLQKDVQQFVCGTLLGGKNPRMKESAMHFIVAVSLALRARNPPEKVESVTNIAWQMHEERGMLFRMFVPGLVDCCEDADGSVRFAAQNTIITLFRDTETKARSDLEKRLEKRCVRKTIVIRILAELANEAADAANNGTIGLAIEGPDLSQGQPAPSKHQSLISNNARDTPPEPTPMSVAEQEAVQLEPLYLESPRDLEETFREMHPWFEGKEAESNWLRREKSILKLRRIAKGNAPHDYTTLFLASIKILLDGILKAVNSLRTTVCTIGCHLVQDLVRVCGSGMDNMVEILLQNLIKLSGNTKKISAAKANDTITAIMANVSYHVRLLHHIHNATQDKNVQPRTYACGWLKTILIKHGWNKNIIEHSGGLDLIQKSITVGLNDGNPSVRENMRPVYWAFAKIWSDQSENIMSSLSQTHQDMLMKNPANPNPSSKTTSTAGHGGKPAFSQSSGPGSSRPSIRETIAAQKRAKAAGKNLPERPGSAESFASPKKTMGPARPATAMSTASRQVSAQSIGTLSSAPVRPRRRADNARHATADASGRKATKPETPPGSPAASPVKTRLKAPALTVSAPVCTPKKVNSPSTSPPKANSSRKLNFAEMSPTNAAEDFTMVIPSFETRCTSPTPIKQVYSDGPLPLSTTAPPQSSSLVLERQSVLSLGNTNPDFTEYAPDNGFVNGSAPSSMTAPSQSSSRALEHQAVLHLGDTNSDFTECLPNNVSAHSSMTAPSRSSFRVLEQQADMKLGSPNPSFPERRPDNGSVPSSTTALFQSSSQALEQQAASNLGSPNPNFSGDTPNNGYIPRGTSVVKNLRSMTSNSPSNGIDRKSNHEGGHTQAQPRILSAGLSSRTKDIGRISMSPRNVVGRKENMRPRKHFAERQRPLKVYEDPVDSTTGTSKPSPTSPRPPRALGERPINEPAGQNYATDDIWMQIGWSHKHYQGWKTAKDTEHRRSSSIRSISNPLHARRVLQSGITAIRARSIDYLGFRKLKTLWPSAPESIWDDGYKFEELLTVLLDCLEDVHILYTPLFGPASEIKREALEVIKLMLEHQRDYFVKFYPQVLCVLITVRKYARPASRMRALLEQTAVDIVADCEPSAPIADILDVVEVDQVSETHLFGLHVLAELLNQCHEKDCDISAKQIERLEQHGIAHLEDRRPEIRHAAIELLTALRYNLEEKTFWRALTGVKSCYRSLITYYLERDRDFHR